jgi:hypothetical protein
MDEEVRSPAWGWGHCAHPAPIHGATVTAAEVRRTGASPACHSVHDNPTGCFHDHIPQERTELCLVMDASVPHPSAEFCHHP